MKLSEAWAEIKNLGNANRLLPKQVYSIISDYGVFKEMSRIQIITKIALQNGLWDILKSATLSTSEIEHLRNKLQFYGFSEEIIQLLFVECNIAYGSYKDYNTEHYDQNQILTQNAGISISQSSNYNPPTRTSSYSDIEIYLNSIFEIDQMSFQRHGLTLQRINPIKWEKGAGLYRDKFGVCLSFEIIGITEFGGSAEVEVYDLNGFLRSIQYLSSVYIQGKYSVINESKIVDLGIPPQNISKMILHIGVDGVHLGNAFYRETKSILRYDGCIQNETETFDIFYTQILYAEGLKKGNVSVFFRYKIKKDKKKCRWVGETNLYIVLFDKSGSLRQRISLFDSMEYYNIANKNDNQEHCSFSNYPVYSDGPSLKMPFNEIGKIIFIEE